MPRFSGVPPLRGFSDNQGGEVTYSPRSDFEPLGVGHVERHGVEMVKRQLRCPLVIAVLVLCSVLHTPGKKTGI